MTFKHQNPMYHRLATVQICQCCVTEQSKPAMHMIVQKKVPTHCWPTPAEGGGGVPVKAPRIKKKKGRQAPPLIGGGGLGH